MNYNRVMSPVLQLFRNRWPRQEVAPPAIPRKLAVPNRREKRKRWASVQKPRSQTMVQRLARPQFTVWIQIRPRVEGQRAKKRTEWPPETGYKLTLWLIVSSNNFCYQLSQLIPRKWTKWKIWITLLRQSKNSAKALTFRLTVLSHKWWDST